MPIPEYFPALTDKQSLILADKLVHASIIDGILLSGAPYQRYRHNDYEHLEQLLAKYVHAYEQIIIVTESIFSMDGDIADLGRLVSLKKRYPNIWLYVDEAHAIGVRGENGLGVAEEQDCIRDIDLLVGTFGKALGSMGAYLLCSRTVREYLINTMRPLIFSTAPPPAQIAWTKFLFEMTSQLYRRTASPGRYQPLAFRGLERERGRNIGKPHHSFHYWRKRRLYTNKPLPATERLLLPPRPPSHSPQRDSADTLLINSRHN